MFLTLHSKLSRSRPRRASVRRRTLGLEPLERRTVLSTFTVTNGHDGGMGSLRRAIADANDAAGADTIVFARSVHEVDLTGGRWRSTAS